MPKKVKCYLTSESVPEYLSIFVLENVYWSKLVMAFNC